MQASIWEETGELPRFDTLKGDQKTDVLIIGGGICGILCAYFLHRVGIPYLLVESDRIAGGTTAHTTAKITAQHGLMYAKLIQSAGTEHARMYLEANQRAVAAYKKLCAEFPCDFEEKSAFVYAKHDRRALEEEAAALQRLSFPAAYTEVTELPFATAGAVRMDGQAQFHPLRFLAQIAKDLHIYEGTAVHALEGRTAITNHGRITAQAIIVATHFPIFNRHGSYFLKLYQHRSYMAAFSPAPPLNGMYVDEAKMGLSFRSYRDYLLVAGGGHRTGKPSEGWDALRGAAEAFAPQAKVRYTWAAQDCMSLDGVPYIGRYAKRTPNVYVASGFQKWGITGSMVAAMLLCELVQEREPAWASVFSPQRSMMTLQLWKNGWEAMVNLLTPIPRRCPHMGCALKWNRAEHSWDCPCHGSRFAQDGHLLNNPAGRDLSV